MDIMYEQNRTFYWYMSNLDMFVLFVLLNLKTDFTPVGVHRAHLSPLSASVCSYNGLHAETCSLDVDVHSAHPNIFSGWTQNIYVMINLLNQTSTKKGVKGGVKGGQNQNDRKHVALQIFAHCSAVLKKQSDLTKYTGLKHFKQIT